MIRQCLRLITHTHCRSSEYCPTYLEKLEMHGRLGSLLAEVAQSAVDSILQGL